MVEIEWFSNNEMKWEKMKINENKWKITKNMGEKNGR